MSLTDSFPELGSTFGIFFYSFFGYLFVLLFSWMAQPVLENIEEEDVQLTEKQEVARQGETMRQRQREKDREDEK
jgi:hypothetical protein